MNTVIASVLATVVVLAPSVSRADAVISRSAARSAVVSKLNKTFGFKQRWKVTLNKLLTPNTLLFGASAIVTGRRPQVGTAARRTGTVAIQKGAGAPAGAARVTVFDQMRPLYFK